MGNFFGFVAGIVGIIAYIPYVRDILRGTTRPDRASWLIWAVQYVVLFFSQAPQHATYSLWLPGLQLLGVVLICALSIRFGVGQIDRQKAVLFGGVCAALVLWYTTKNATLALGIALAIEACGVALTARKAYKNPGSETLTMWALIGTAGILGIFAIGPTEQPVLYVYPVALAIMNFAIVASVLLGSKRTAKHPDPENTSRQIA